ncbi:hypothetical protein Pmar_PMAR012135 [Perkinsus marinus ATCC 50983]|uniref:GST C-terminal domain-containing protein n=1 Tax=Perkinsus marinus (strain ATCC 50983 / TXsc) TaxID=423536 RepID=C5LHL1_PERM5|nr:hypothetical protein Pmar_PMAR012135 [Perkinsus marinus ATCC 50983]EER03782.1 hypothetical protein Pmar_PMAR012135 [Perkinsus marinus ATCC 50983]|eukprot:XP_002771966.1 hypothetical protein Pmar_PMAR012135 [Perkinsus marinus ATCC 50983]
MGNVWFKFGQSFEEAASTKGVKCLRWIEAWETQMEDGKFIAGTNTPTVADSCALRVVEEAIEVLGEEKVLGAAPKVAAWRKALLAVPKVAKFMKSSHRMPSTVDDASAKQYYEEVATSLGW